METKEVRKLQSKSQIFIQQKNFLPLNPGLLRIFNFQNTLAIVYITIMLQMSFFTQVQAFTLYNSGY